MTNLHYVGVFEITLAIAKRCFKWGNFASRWSVPCFGNQFFTLLRSANSWSSGFKIATGFQNGPPLFSRTDSSLYRYQKWPPYGGSSLDEQVFSPLERTEQFSMRFNGVFNFVWQCFLSTAISLEWINVVKRSTTVHSTDGWIAQWVMYLAAEPEVGNSIAHRASQNSKPVWLSASCTVPGCPRKMEY